MGEFRSFGRRRGRKLRPQQAGLCERLLPKITIDVPATADTIDVRQDFTIPGAPLSFEIGFGAGEYIFHQAQAKPEHNFLGAEVYCNGVGKLLSAMESEWGEALEKCNIRIYNDDARILISKMPNECVNNVDILFPDPWPKQRHHRRRLINAALIEQVQRLLKVGGTLHIATDHEGYLKKILGLMQNFSQFHWRVSRAFDWRKPCSGVYTRYAEKALIAGGRCYYLHFTRIA